MTGFFFSTGDIYEEAAHHNAIFVGRDEDGVPRYAHQRGTAGNFRLDVKGSDKAFNFCYRGEGERLFVFEAPIDLLSFIYFMCTNMTCLLCCDHTCSFFFYSSEV